MSVVFAGNNSGSFTSTGAAQIIQLPSNLDYMWVYNYTQLATQQTPGRGVYFYWQRGMAADTGIEYKKTDATDALNGVTLASGGFTLVNNTVNVPSAPVAITSITNATPPVVATGSTAGLVANSSIVRMMNVVGAQQLGGIDFTVGTIVANTSFTLRYMRSIAAATTGFYRIIPYDPYFYPPYRIITKISNAVNPIVTLSVNHNFTVGQAVRFSLPTVTANAFGMPLLNQVQANIIAINQADTDGFTNTVTLDVSTVGLGTFAWPLTTDPGFSPPLLVPVGESTATALNAVPQANILGDAEVNQGYFGISLAGGAQSPAGSNNDVIYWVAGKSFNGI